MVDASADRIEKKVEIRAPVARVWRALTDFEQFSAWFGVRLESPFVVGQGTRGHITHPGYEHLILEVTVQKMEPERLFSYFWHPYAIDPQVDYSQEPPTLVEFTLEKITTGTLLIVTESGFDAIPAHRRDEAFRMNSRGWAIQVVRIADYVANHR